MSLKKFIIPLGLATLWIGILASCSTSQHQALKGIELGMDKANVLDLVGNPSRMARVHGQDRWTYETQSKNDRATKTTYIFFSDGRVTYIDLSGTSDQGPTLDKSQKQSDSNFKPVGD